MQQYICKDHQKEILNINLQPGYEEQRIFCSDCKIDDKENIFPIAELDNIIQKINKQKQSLKVSIEMKQKEFISLINILREHINKMESQFQMELNYINQYVSTLDESMDLEQQLQTISTQVEVDEDKQLILQYDKSTVTQIDKYIKQLEELMKSLSVENEKQSMEMYIFQDKLDIEYGYIDLDFVEKPMIFNQSGDIVNAINRIKNTIVILNKNNGKWHTKQELKGHRHDIYAIVAGKDFIISGGKAELLLWKLHQGQYEFQQEIWKLENESNYIISAALNENEDILIIGWKYGQLTLHQYHNQQWNLIETNAKHKKLITAISIYKSYVAVGSVDKIISIWDISAQSLKLLKYLNDHTSMITSLQWFELNNCLISASSDGSIRIYKLDDNFKQIQSIQNQGRINSLQLQSKTMITLHDLREIKIWKYLGEVWCTIQEIRRNQWFITYQSILLSKDEKELVVTMATHKYKNNQLKFYQQII